MPNIPDIPNIPDMPENFPERAGRCAAENTEENRPVFSQQIIAQSVCRENTGPAASCDMM